MNCFRAGFQAGLVAFFALFLAGCTTIPSRLYTSETKAGVDNQAPPPCDTFYYGEHPIVFVEGFKHVPGAILDISKDGHWIDRVPISLHTGDVLNTTIDPAPPSAANVNGPPDTITVTIEYGVTIDLGKTEPGSYDLRLSTNQVLATTAHFTVLPAWFEVRRQELLFDRRQLQSAIYQLDQLKTEIQKEKSDTGAPDASSYNAKVVQYNNLIQNTWTRAAAYNDHVQEFNRSVNPQGSMPAYNVPEPWTTVITNSITP